MKIAYRYWSKAVPIFYVAQVPGEAGADWGYVTEAAKAKPLNPYWQRRFAADCRAVGVTAQFI